MKGLISFVCGIIFAIGLGISGMTDPNKVLGFLTISPSWDPSLAMVMVGAIAVHASLYLLFRKREAPVLDENFSNPAATNITPQLIGGSLLFGVGWGMGGFCPGPAVVALVSLSTDVGVFLCAMFCGFFLVNLVRYATSFRNMDANIHTS